MRKPKTGIMRQLLKYACALCILLYFFKHCNSSQMGNPSRLPSLLSSEVTGYLIVCVADCQLVLWLHAGLWCIGCWSVKERRTREQIGGGNCTVSTWGLVKNAKIERAFSARWSRDCMKWQNPRAEALKRLIIGWQQMKRAVNEMGEAEFGWETVYLCVSKDAGWCLFTGVIRQV